MTQWDQDALATLRASVFRADGSVVDVLRGRLTDDVLQLAGDGLLDAVVQKVDGAVELAARCVSALRERGWAGDAELATQLEGTLGEGAMPLLRPLAVDLEMLSAFLEGGPLDGVRIDLWTGDIWTDELDIDEDEGADDADRWLPVPVWMRATPIGIWSCSSAP